MTIPEYPHSETLESLAEQMETSKKGLNNAGVQKNLSIYGLNEIRRKKA